MPKSSKIGFAMKFCLNPQHGAYMTSDTLEKALTSPDFLIQLATNLKEEKQKRIEAEQKIQKDAPKVLLPMPFQLLNVLAWLLN